MDIYSYVTHAPSANYIEVVKLKGKTELARIINSHFESLLHEVIEAEKDLRTLWQPLNYTKLKIS